MESTKETAVRHVIQAQQIVARQRERVKALSLKGLDTTEAEHTLELFVSTLRIFEGDLARILSERKDGQGA